ncbi:MAG: hypothetical protein ACXWT3_12935 [Methylococcaceae bacterium]
MVTRLTRGFMAVVEGGGSLAMNGLWSNGTDFCYVDLSYGDDFQPDSGGFIAAT